ncbi:DUF2357 domain-containing protein [Bacillus cereus]|nr:DUF2357 domain-containing protein [Bacillus cereus]
MVSPLSGSNNEIELVKIETEELSLTIKGNPYHEKYESLKEYYAMNADEMMYFHVDGKTESVSVFDARLQRLDEGNEHPPIFFENRSYQLVVVPKNNKRLSFYHEHPGFRKQVSSIQMGSLHVLMGNLSFPNEVGNTTFEIKDEQDTLLTVTFEVFPAKLDYKDDYRALLDEVNDEIYNLAFHLLKRTYLGASAIYATNPSRSEFYRILNDSFERFMKSISHIKRQPHHTLMTRHQLVRGEKIRKLDSVGMNYLRKRPHLLQGENNIPTKGITAYKEVSYDTLENRFVKWMLQRVVHKIDDLLKALEQKSRYTRGETDEDLLERVKNMKYRMKNELNDPFWRGIGKLDRSVFSLVIQMAAGYRDAYQIFLMLSRGLTLRGQIFKMSVKDVARLYEYWTYLKLGQILSKKYIPLHQDVIQVKQDGLYVTLDESKTAKYRIDFAESSHYKRKYGAPGPMEEDINTMHRYRDALVVEQEGPFERTAYGAYVLFPWNQEEEYENHPFYKSIEKVNIGGFPFLPNATRLVEQFLDHLIEKSPEEIIKEGILPRGTKEEWHSSLEEKVLVGSVKTEAEYETYRKNGLYQISVTQLKPGWQEAKYIALYAPKKWHGEKGGIQYVAKIKHIQMQQNDEYVHFELEPWKKLDHLIRPVGYGIQTYTITTMSLLKEVQELPELFMKSKEERTLWKTLRRFTKQVKIELDHNNLDEASSVKSYYVEDVQVWVDYENGVVMVGRDGRVKEVPLELVVGRGSVLFREVLGVLNVGE